VNRIIHLYETATVSLFIFTNKNVDIKGALDVFLEHPSSGTLKIERLETQIIKKFGNNKTKITLG
jgi:hypothetical protein